MEFLVRQINFAQRKPLGGDDPTFGRKVKRKYCDLLRLAVTFQAKVYIWIIREQQD